MRTRSSRLVRSLAAIALCGAMVAAAWPVSSHGAGSVDDGPDQSAASAKKAPAKTSVVGQESPNKTGKEPAKPAGSVFTPEREAAALSFVQQHHPELNGLLAQLKAKRPKEYQSAANELFRASERLTLTKEQNPQRYELDLRVWKLDSRLRLLAARLMVADNPALEAEARDLLAEKIALQLESQQLERQRLQNRLDKVDAAIAKLEQSRDEQVDAAYDKLLSGIAESRPKNKAKAKPGAKASPAAGSKNGAAGEAGLPQ